MVKQLTYCRATIVEQITYTLKDIPSGVEGIKETLKMMAWYARHYKTNRHVRELTLKLVSSIPEKRYKAEAQALLSFVQNKIRYVKDINGVETVQSPEQTLRLMAGDCDDKATLLAAMLESIGHPARFIAMGPKGAPKNVFTHVFVETKIGGSWLPAETIMRGWSLGRRPKHHRNVIIQGIKK